ncbi:MAG: hypothetical protein ACM3NQ_19725 [Bacteroidales bacterium]
MNAIEFAGVVKDYHALRPLRVRDLAVAEGEIVTIGGLDLSAAEVFTGLVTGSVLPDTGAVRVFGEETSAVESADGWLATLDRFGVVSGRVALLDGFTVEQNIAIPLTLEVDALPPDIVQAVRLVAARVGLAPGLLGTAAGTLAPPMQFRLRLARAVAPSPRILLVEHPGGCVPAADLPSAAAAVRDVARHGRLTTIVISEDAECRRIADRQLALDPSTGILRRVGIRKWFS